MRLLRSADATGGLYRSFTRAAVRRAWAARAFNAFAALSLVAADLAPLLPPPGAAPQGPEVMRQARFAKSKEVETLSHSGAAVVRLQATTETPTATETPTPPAETPTPDPCAASSTPDPSGTPPSGGCPTGTAIPTEPASATPTPADTETPTPSPSATETETGTPTPTPESSIVLSLSTDPPAFGPSGRVLLDWRIEGLDLGDPQASSLQILLPAGVYLLPRGLSPQEVPDIEVSEGEISIPLRSPTGRLSLIAADDAVGPFPIHAEVIQADLPLAEADLELQEDRFVRIEAAGGEATGLDGRVRARFPADSIAGPIWVRIRPPTADSAPAYSLSGLPFEILAEERGQSGGPPGGGLPPDVGQPQGNQNTQQPTPTGEPGRVPLRQFLAPISIEISYQEDRLNGDENSLIVFYYDEVSGTWQPLPTQVDIENNLVTAQTDHLSVFDINAQNLEAARLPDMAAFQTSLFTGAATYSYPLWVPPVPGGLQPDLVLTYNSQTVDSATSVTQASWVGMGWDLSTGAIVRDTHGTIDYAGDDTFSFSAGGVSSLLLPGADGYYHTVDESFWRIQYSPGPPDSWKAWDGAGNEYRFEDRALFPECATPTTVTNRTWRWSLTSIRNPFNQQLTFTYAKESKDVSGFCGSATATMDVAVYPDTVVYPHNRYRIVFVRQNDRLDSLADWTADASRVQFQRSRLSNVRIERDADGNGSFETLMRRYDLTFESHPPKRATAGVSWRYFCDSSGCSAYQGGLTLARVQEFGAGGTASLPSLEFTYSGNHLYRAENGYGGKVEFDYETWADAGGPRQETQTCQDLGFQGWTYGLCSDSTSQGRFYIFPGYSLSVNTSLVQSFAPGGAYLIQVTAHGCSGCSASLEVGIHDGVTERYLPTTALPDAGTPVTIQGTITLSQNATQAQVLLRGTSLSSTNSWSVSSYRITAVMTRYRVTAKRVYDGINAAAQTFTYAYTGAASNGAGAPEATRYVEPYSEFRGHADVTETGPGGRVTTSFFHQHDPRRGRARETEIRTSSPNTLLRETITDYTFEEQAAASNDPAVFPHKPDGGFYSDLQIWWTYVTRTEDRVYRLDQTYDATQTEYLYLTADQGGAQHGNLTRSIESSRNGTLWTAYRGTRTLFYPADDATTYLVSLPAVSERFSCEGGCDFQSADLLATTWYLYDGRAAQDIPPAVGKLTGQRIWADGPSQAPRFQDTTYGYDAWGNTTSETGCTAYGTSAALASSGCQTTSMTYDTTYHTYATAETNPLGHQTIWSYDYTLAVPTQETDPNLATTTASYDTFGRITSLRRPGDETGPASLAISYFDAALPYWIQVRQRTTGASTNTLRNIYDGLGRRVQSQTAGAALAEGTKDVIVDFTYNAYGEVTLQSAPYGVLPWSGSGNPYRSPQTQPGTTTAYDQLGRPVSVTATDGSAQAFTYNGLQTTSADALNRAAITTMDVWGRTGQVSPPLPPPVSYAYDVLDRLKTASMGGGTVILEYDPAGRKLSMSDPDLGFWSYVYDAAGNLTRQTDARGCSTDFRYDALDRLVLKSYAGPGACGSTVAVGYSYDSGSNGIGRRSGMTDVSGTSAWTYDARGRMTSETRTVAGAGTYLTQWGYDSADQVVWMRYPGGSNGEQGETVSFSYHPQQALDAVTSDLGTAYVQGTSYDAAGRVELRSFSGGAFQTDFRYFPWTTRPGQGRLQQIISGIPSVLDSLQDLHYTYNDVGDILSIVDDRAGPQTQTFTYDVLDRLETASVSGGTSGLYSESYGYDSGTGNLASKGGDPYAYNDLAHDHAVTHLGGVERYRYDATGNQAWRSFDGNTHDLTYDGENRLVEVRQGGTVIAEFLYDGNGELVREVSGGQTTVYVGRHQEVVLSPTPGPTATPTASPSPSATPTHTLTPTAAPATASPTPSATRTSTPTRAATLTPTSTVTPTSTGVATGTGLTGEYFDNSNLTVLKVTRVDPTVNFSWGSGSPDPSIGPEQFSVRWTGYMQPQFTETYTFYVYHDDGARLWVNGQRLFDRWVDCVCETTGTIALTAGVRYSIRLEYYDNTAGATAKLSWSSASQPKQIIPQARLYAAPPPSPVVGAGSGLQGEYFDNGNLTAWKLTRTDATVNFAWGDGSPDPSIGANSFSVRWTGLVQPQYTETYTFHVFHDDGARLWVNNQLLVDRWTDCYCETSGSISLTAGVKHAIRLEYYDNTAGATARLSWSSPHQTKQVVPKTQLYPPVPPPTPVPGGSGSGLSGEYFNNTDFTAWKLNRTDATVNFNWGSGSPASGIAGDTFSVRWTGEVQPQYNETYTFHLLHDDGVRLWVDNQLLISHWASCGGCNSSGTIALSAGVKYPIRLEYYENTGGAQVALSWSNIYLSRTIIPQSQLYPTPPAPTATPVPSVTPTRTPLPTPATTPTAPPSGLIWRSYYFVGTQRIAMRVSGDPTPANNGVFYLLGDHLGSSNVIVDSTGNLVSELRYKAWGETRYSSGTTPTDYRYTGQREEAGIGLYYYRARWYDPALGRFAQADTITAGLGPSAWDRYAYAHNNPLRYTDPSGHCIWDLCLVETLTVAAAAAVLIGGLVIYYAYYAEDLTRSLNDGVSGFPLTRPEGSGAEGQPLQSPLPRLAINPGPRLGTNPSIGSNVLSQPRTRSEGLFLSRPARRTPSPDTIFQTSERWKIYEGSTSEGERYIGRTSRRQATREAEHRRRGRGLTLREIDEALTLEEARFKEQLHINLAGGINNLLNRRNEINPRRFKELLDKYFAE